MTIVGLLGGAFNPPHVAHALVGLYVLETQPIDRLWLVPTWKNAFGKQLAPYDDRVAMCALVAAVAPAQCRSTWRSPTSPVAHNWAATAPTASSLTATITTSASSRRSGGAGENAATPATEAAARAASGRRAHRPSTGTPAWRRLVATAPAPTMNVLGERVVTGTILGRRYSE